jgi:hypothetical protein
MKINIKVVSSKALNSYNDKSFPGEYDGSRSITIYKNSIAIAPIYTITNTKPSKLIPIDVKKIAEQIKVNINQSRE